MAAIELAPEVAGDFERILDHLERHAAHDPERRIRDIIEAIESHLQPKGVAVMIDAAHQCMTTRGVHHRHVSTITTRFTGVFKTDTALKDRFLRLAKG